MIHLRLSCKTIGRVVIISLVLSAASAALAQNPQQLAWSTLQSGATDKDSQQRVTAITALAVISNDPKAVTMAEPALKDQIADVRAAAAVTLGTLKATSSIPQLIEAIKDPEGNVVMAAAKALVDMHNEDGYDVYYAVATGEMKSGAGLVGGEEKQLNQILHNPKDLAETAFEQGIGFVPFGGIGFGAFQAIHKNESSQVMVKATALKMLATDPDPRSGKALVSASTDQNWVIRAAAYDSIARRGDPSLLSSAAMGLTDQNAAVKFAAAAAVAQLAASPKR